jgi:diguanylate cyclase (GGDEF)-like protein/PAS domain S-box-containing protein
MDITPLILVVDVDVLLQSTTVRLLDQAGYRTCKANDGLTSLQIIREQKPALTLLNVNLPDLSGLEVCRLIKNDPALAECFVMLVSETGSDSKIQVEGLKAGADGSITYPITSMELQARVLAMLRIQKTEQALRENREQMREILENSLDASYKRNLRTKTYDYLSPVFASISGYSLNEMQTMPLEDVIDLMHPADNLEVERVLGTATSKPTGTSHQVEYRFRHKDGLYRWFHDRFTVIRDAQGQPLALIGSVSDITERKQAELALREKELFINGVLNSLTEQIAVLDDQGVIVKVNKAWEDFASANDSSDARYYVGTNYLTVCDSSVQAGDESAAFAATGLRAVMTGSQPSFRLEYPCHSPTTQHWFNMTALPQNEPHRGVVVIHHEITERKQMEKALRDSEAKYRIVADNTYDWECWIDAQGCFLYNSPSCKKITGYDAAAFFEDPTLLRRLVHADDLAIFDAHHKDHEREKATHEIEFRIMHADGEIRWLNHICQAVWDTDQNFLGNRISNRDITDDKRIEEELRASEQLYHNMFDNILVVKLMIDPVNGAIFKANQAAANFYGWSIDTLQGMNINEINTLPEEEIKAELQRAVTEARTYFNFRHRLASGEVRDVEVYSSPIEIGGRKLLFSIIHDSTDRKKAEEQINSLNAELEKLALTDYLTNLPNRRHFMERGAEEFKRSRRNSQPFAFLMLDIDHFKKVNDMHGHDVGDRALQSVAACLKSSLREIDIIGRIGGEEFAVILPATSLEKAVLLAERVRQTIANTVFAANGGTFTLTVSIGAAVFEDEMSRLNDLFRKADEALYRAKQNGRNCVMQ